MFNFLINFKNTKLFSNSVYGGFYCSKVQIQDNSLPFVNGVYELVAGSACHLNRPYYKIPTRNLFINYSSFKWRITTIACATGFYRF